MLLGRLACRYAVLLEVAGLKDDGANSTGIDAQMAAQVENASRLTKRFQWFGLSWEEARGKANYWLSFSLLGRFSETIRQGDISMGQDGTVLIVVDEFDAPAETASENATLSSARVPTRAGRSECWALGRN